MTDIPPRKTLTLKRKPVTKESTSEASQELEEKKSRAMKLTGKRIVRRENTSETSSRRPSRPSHKHKNQSNKEKGHAGGAHKPPNTLRKNSEDQAPPPSELQAKSFDKLLHELYPIWRDYRPLILGIEEELYGIMQKKHPPASRRVLQRLLRMHCRHGKYLQALLGGQERYTLSGEAQGEITTNEREYAQRTLESYEKR